MMDTVHVAFVELLDVEVALKNALYCTPHGGFGRHSGRGGPCPRPYHAWAKEFVTVLTEHVNQKLQPRRQHRPRLGGVEAAEIVQYLQNMNYDRYDIAPKLLKSCFQEASRYME